MAESIIIALDNTTDATTKVQIYNTPSKPQSISDTKAAIIYPFAASIKTSNFKNPINSKDMKVNKKYIIKQPVIQ